MQLNYDYIVVGSGAAGAIAAYALAKKGVNVAVLDVGIEDETYRSLIPNKDFVSIRREEEQQHRYFLGKNFEGIVWDASRVGSQLTPPRNFLVDLTEKFIPFQSDSFKPMESLAKGGLGGGWGLGCYTFSKAEAEAAGLNYDEMKKAYQAVADHIGISGEKDDTAPYCLDDLQNIQKAPAIETNLNGLLQTYLKKRARLNKNNVFVGRPGLAVITENKDNRKALQYKDMDFWSDEDKSAYRSWITIEQLQSLPNFAYHKNCLVLKFEESEQGVKVFVKRTDTNEEQIFACKKLVLASGVLGTARIVIRSFDYRKTQLPIICNPYCYIPCVQWRMLGKQIEQYKGSFSQLTMFVDENKNNFDVPMVSLYSYRSLLLYKLIKEAPLNFADARIFMQYLQSSFTIAGIHHPERASATKFIQLKKETNSFTGDVLTGQYILSNEEEAQCAKREQKIKSALRTLGCLPIKTVYTPHGGSIHYAGTLPFNDANKEFTIAPNGKLHGTKNVFVADGSGFNYLPAKGLTLSLMANAFCVANNVLKNE